MPHAASVLGLHSVSVEVAILALPLAQLLNPVIIGLTTVPGGVPFRPCASAKKQCPLVRDRVTSFSRRFPSPPTPNLTMHMTDSQDITKAIGAHAKWKNRVTAAIRDGHCEKTPAEVESDHLCDLGKWLSSLPPSDGSSEHFRKVQALHVAFHKEAAKVLQLALSGQKAAAAKCLDFGGLFAHISADLTSALTAWKKAIDSEQTPPPASKVSGRDPRTPS
jgi:hypothetical protein